MISVSRDHRFGGALALFCIPLLLGSKAPAPNPATTHRNSVERGEYLVAYGGCSDCHTPLKMGPTGPEPDLSRYLAGHPQEAVLPQPPALPMDSWSVATAGLTAWSGPWGISYAANLTPDVNTGMGIWTEEIFINALDCGGKRSATPLWLTFRRPVSGKRVAEGSESAVVACDLPAHSKASRAFARAKSRPHAIGS